MNLIQDVLTLLFPRPGKFQPGEAVQCVGQEKIMVVHHVIRKGKSFIVHCQRFSEEGDKTIIQTYDESELRPLDWFQLGHPSRR
jgi:hypothetical protein